MPQSLHCGFNIFATIKSAQAKIAFTGSSEPAMASIQHVRIITAFLILVSIHSVNYCLNSQTRTLRMMLTTIIVVSGK